MPQQYVPRINLIISDIVGPVPSIRMRHCVMAHLADMHCATAGNLFLPASLSGRKFEHDEPVLLIVYILTLSVKKTFALLMTAVDDSYDTLACIYKCRPATFWKTG